MGTIKSAIGIGGLLSFGIGDTIRVSLSADPVEEVSAARDILKALGIRRDGPNLISCPTCGRTRIDLIRLAQEVEQRLGDLNARGVTLQPGQTLRDLYEERTPLYEKYADLIIDCSRKMLRDVVAEIAERYKKQP